MDAGVIANYVNVKINSTAVDLLTVRCNYATSYLFGFLIDSNLQVFFYYRFLHYLCFNTENVKRLETVTLKYDVYDSDLRNCGTYV